MRRFSLLVPLALGLAACGTCSPDTRNNDPSVEAGGDNGIGPVVLAVEVIRNIEANPAHTAVVLETAGLEVTDFQDLMARIAADEELSRRFIEETGE